MPTRRKGRDGHCRDCDDELTPENQYAVDRREGRYICRQCRILAARRSAESNPERRREVSYGGRLRRQYGLTLDDYAVLLEAQSGVCALCCDGQQGERTGRLFVDHDHATGEIRGLLCRRCNSNLAWLENVGRDAIDTYLERESVHVGVHGREA